MVPHPTTKIPYAVRKIPILQLKDPAKVLHAARKMPHDATNITQLKIASVQFSRSVVSPTCHKLQILHATS